MACLGVWVKSIISMATSTPSPVSFFISPTGFNFFSLIGIAPYCAARFNLLIYTNQKATVYLSRIYTQLIYSVAMHSHALSMLYPCFIYALSMPLLWL
jgi:hypothetical protein